MRAAHALRHAILGSLGLGGLGLAGAGCSQARGTADGTDVVLPPPSSADVVTTRPSAERAKPTLAGYVDGPKGFHRASAERCDPTIALPACQGDEANKFCSTDADCTAQPHGKCTTGSGQIGRYCGCTYSCESDADCPATGGEGDAKVPQVCVCKNALGAGAESAVCAPASCRADSECETGACGVSIHHNGCFRRVELACRTSEDTCETTRDCKNGGQCAVQGGAPRGPDAKPAKWSCQGMTCVIGRPLVVDGVAERAQPTERADWCALLEDGESSHAAASRFWLDAAALEHASVASFSRFSLQLLALGAPPGLLVDTHAAALDEIEHARLAYGLAGKLGARSRGPARLPAATSPIATDVAAIVEGLVVEGCVGETLGALEASAQLEDATGAARRVLERIAPDEARHAELAWRSLAWLVAEHGSVASDAATRAFEQAAREVRRDLPPTRDASPRHGLLSAEAIRAVRLAALREVVEPLARAVLSSASSSPS